MCYVSTPGERPDFRQVPEFLWGEVNYDSDGNSFHPASRRWTELYLSPRDRSSVYTYLNIVPHQSEPLVLRIHASDRCLAMRAAYLLASYTGGGIALTPDGPFTAPEEWAAELGSDFDLAEAMARFHASPFARSTLEHPYPNLDAAE